MRAAPIPDAPSPASSVVATYPDDFGATYVGRTIRLLFSTGWSEGTILKYNPRKTRMFDVRFLNEKGSRDCTLVPATYFGVLNAPQGAWHLLVPTDQIQTDV